MKQETCELLYNKYYILRSSWLHGSHPKLCARLTQIHQLLFYNFYPYFYKNI